MRMSVTATESKMKAKKLLECEDHEEAECKKVEDFFECVRSGEDLDLPNNSSIPDRRTSTVSMESTSSMDSVRSAASERLVGAHDHEDVEDLPKPVKCKAEDQCNCLDEHDAPVNECDEDECEQDGGGIFKCVEEPEDSEQRDCAGERDCDCFDKDEDEIRECD